MINSIEPKHLKPFVQKILSEDITKFEVLKYVNSQTDKETSLYFFEDFETLFFDISINYFFNISKENNLIQICEKMIEDVNFQIDNNVIIEDLQFIKDFINDSKDLYNFTPLELINRTKVIVPYFILYGIKSTEIGNIDYLYKIYKLIKSKLTPLEDTYSTIDLSDTKAIDKIIYLQQLGVIEFLRTKQPFNTSINSLASVLSAVTGEKSITLQPSLNPMISKNVVDKNYPLNSKKAVDRVEQNLIKIGFKLK